ncbi:MAG TPA: sulfotransferase [Solirubrobacteraceae bacterium]|nr:sulfotransferase [Solirubrobacteraceae bacterium]
MAGTARSSEPAAASGERRPKVFYVMGAGRSGSTILGVALGNCDGVLFAGELDRWFMREGVPRREDERLRAFWAEVLEQVGDAGDVLAARTGWLERSSGLLNPRKWRTRRRLRPRYREVSERLYRTLVAVSGEECVVDTSHYPLRARELQALGGVELHLLWLVRDPQSVVASLGRADVVERRFDVPTSNAYLWLTNLLSLLVFLRHPRRRRMFVRHEDFVADPAGVLERILASAGSGAGAPDLQALRTGVPFHGNRLVQTEVVALNARPEAPARRSWLTALLQLPWRAVFAIMRPTARG